jgi:hypothetical protein
VRGEALALLSPFQKSELTEQEATLDRSMLETLQTHHCDGAAVVYPIKLLSAITVGQNAKSRSHGLLVIGKVHDQPPCRGLLVLTGRAQERNYFGSIVTQGLESATGNASSH